MTTTEKIAKLGKLYKAMCNCRDEFAVVENVSPEDAEVLLAFARSIAGPDGYDREMTRLINGFRGMLENAVHTAAGR